MRLNHKITLTIALFAVCAVALLAQRSTSRSVALSIEASSDEKRWAVTGLVLGAVSEGATIAINMRVRNITNRTLTLDMFAVGSKISASWLRQSPQSSPVRYINRISIPPGGVAVFSMTFRANDPSVQDLQIVNLMESSIVLARLVVKYQIRPGSVHVVARTPPLVSGLKAHYNANYYRLCSGAAPFGYSFVPNGVSFKAEAGGDHPRMCGYHVDCKAETPSDQDVCYKFSIQGDESGDVLHVPAILDVTYALKNATPYLE